MWSTTASTLTLRLLVRWLLLAAWPLHLLVLVPLAVTESVAFLTAQPAVGDAALRLGAHYLCGAWLSFAVHETGHAVALTRGSGVARFTLIRTSWRFSITTEEVLDERRVIWVAVSGPGAAVAGGLLLWLIQPGWLLHGWYLTHALFLLPMFGDGRAVLHGFTAMRRKP